MSSPKEQWQSYFGFLMAVIASAVGLGSIWRFPYVVGSNGGSAFILAYVFLMVFLGIIGMATEIAMGRHSGVDAVDSFIKITGKGKILGYIAISTGFLLISIYSVLGGWVLNYLYQSLIFRVTSLPSDYFNTFISSLQPVFWQIIFIILCLIIVSSGVSSGIEKYSIHMNILLFIMIIIIAIRSLTLPGAEKGVQFLLQPDFSKLKDSNMWLMAAGQAFFSLSLGSGSMISYGCYLSKKSPILISSAITGLATILIAILMGFAIFPAVFAVGANPTSGAGLLFDVLPLVFARIAGGWLFAILFFTATFFAAITSAISMIEPFIQRIINVKNISRKSATRKVAFFLILVSLPMSLSFGKLSHIQLFHKSIFDNVDFLLDKIMMPLNSVIVLIITGWFWRPKGILSELSNNGTIKLPASFFLLWMIRIIVPTIIIIILLKPLLNYILH